MIKKLSFVKRTDKFLKRSFATENKENKRVVVVGGGCGGLSVGSKLASRLGAKVSLSFCPQNQKVTKNN